MTTLPPTTRPRRRRLPPPPPLPSHYGSSPPTPNPLPRSTPQEAAFDAELANRQEAYRTEGGDGEGTAADGDRNGSFFGCRKTLHFMRIRSFSSTFLALCLALVVRWDIRSPRQYRLQAYRWP